MKIIKIKNGVPFKYGVLINEPTIGENEVSYTGCKDTIHSDKFVVIEDTDISEEEVWCANEWKAHLHDKSIYINIIDEYRYRKCYEKLYAEEIAKSINAWAKLITESNKYRKSEDFDEDEDFDGDIAGQFRTSY